MTRYDTSQQLLRCAILLVLTLEFAQTAQCAKKSARRFPQANLNYLSIYVADARVFSKTKGSKTKPS